MTPQDDNQLQVFLQAHRVVPPPPATDLEDQIMAAITTESPSVSNSNQGGIQAWLPHLVWLSVASTAIVGASLQWMLPSRSYQMAELSELELFLESTWLGVTADPAPDTLEWLSL